MRMLLLLIFIPFLSYSAEFKQGWSMEFVGKLDGKKEIRLLLFRSKSDNLKGSFYNVKELKRYEVKGKISGSKVDFKVIQDNKETAVFQGVYRNDENPTLEGTYSKGENTHSTTLSYHIQFPAVPGENLYEPICAESTEAVETFCAKLKKDILTGNKADVAAIIYYPMNVYVDGKMDKIETDQEFITKFDKIFYPAFKEKIKENCIPMNMCNSYKGVWFGFNREMVIQMISQKDDEPFRLKLAEIHNKPEK